MDRRTKPKYRDFGILIIAAWFAISFVMGSNYLEREKELKQEIVIYQQQIEQNVQIIEEIQQELDTVKAELVEIKENRKMLEELDGKVSNW